LPPNIYNYSYSEDKLSKASVDYNADGKDDLVYNYNSDNLVSKLAVDYYNDSTIDIEYIYEYIMPLKSKTVIQ
jgi:hypothetical protein